MIQGWSAVLLPVHARDKLGGAIDLGMLEALFSAGALTGALVYGSVGSRFRRWPVFTVAFLIVGMPRFVVAAFTDTVAPLAVMMAIEGLGEVKRLWRDGKTRRGTTASGATR